MLRNSIWNADNAQFMMKRFISACSNTSALVLFWCELDWTGQEGFLTHILPSTCIVEIPQWQQRSMMKIWSVNDVNSCVTKQESFQKCFVKAKTNITQRCVLVPQQLWILCICISFLLFVWCVCATTPFLFSPTYVNTWIDEVVAYPVKKKKYIYI